MDQPLLSKRGRVSLEVRLRRLEDERIPRLRADLGQAADDVGLLAALQAAEKEATTLRETLAAAAPLETAPNDPAVVDLGDAVSIRPVGDGGIERYMLVEELEARIEPSWISVESPLGSALLGARVGDEVEVRAPAGTVRYEVLEIERAVR